MSDLHNRDAKGIGACVSTALREDIGSGDITADLIEDDLSVTASIVCRETAVFCGSAWLDEVYHQLDSTLVIDWQIKDGSAMAPGQTLCTLAGSAKVLLTGERTGLNFLQTLSATATQTQKFVDAVAGTHTKILDTRKTIPGLRVAQKYAVRCGGGTNHRMGLYDAILIKENHIAAAGSIAYAVSTARKLHPGISVEVETENLDEVQAALDASAEIIMLDNFELETMRKAVTLNHSQSKLEASGGVSLETVRAIAETGVDYISVGTLTKDIRAIDLSMRVD